MSDPTLLDAFRKQCAHTDPGLVFLAWQGQAGVDQDDLIDILKEMDTAAPTAGQDKRVSADMVARLAGIDEPVHVRALAIFRSEQGTDEQRATLAQVMHVHRYGWAGTVDEHSDEWHEWEECGEDFEDWPCRAVREALAPFESDQP